MPDAIVITTTTATREEARDIAKQLIVTRRAACVQIEGPIESHYFWDGESRCDQEWRLSIKTMAALFTAVQESIQEIHSYDEPEIIATHISDGSEAYLQWIRKQSHQSKISND